MNFVYASETDLLDVALFGVIAKQWRELNPKLKDNTRDHAKVYQLFASLTLNLQNS